MLECGTVIFSVLAQTSPVAFQCGTLLFNVFPMKILVDLSIEI